MKKVFNIIKTTLVWLILLYEGIKFFNLFHRYKQEQMEELKALKAQLESDQKSVAVATETPSDKVADTATQCNKRGGEDDVESK